MRLVGWRRVHLGAVCLCVLCVYTPVCMCVCTCIANCVHTCEPVPPGQGHHLRNPGSMSSGITRGRELESPLNWSHRGGPSGGCFLAPPPPPLAGRRWEGRQEAQHLGALGSVPGGVSPPCPARPLHVPPPFTWTWCAACCHPACSFWLLSASVTFVTFPLLSRKWFRFPGTPSGP